MSLVDRSLYRSSAAVDAVLDRIEAELVTAAPEPADDGHSGVTNDPPEARRIVVLSPKGGAGRTTVATNLAVAFAARPSRGVALVDLALAFGDVATAML